MSNSYNLVNSTGDLATGDLDIDFDSVGRLVVLTGQDKLVQAIQKILFTEQNYFYNQYKTELQSLIGTAPRVDAFKQLLAQRVTDSLLYLQLLQQGQQKYQTLDGGEVLAKINEILVTYGGDVSTDTSDLTLYTVEVRVSNSIGQAVNVTGTFNMGGS